MRSWWLMLLGYCSLLQAAPPSRVVALSWDAAEQLLELGVTPLAVADKDEYAQWVVHPTLPPQVRNAGSRLEPNLELLLQLKPDLLLIGPALAALEPQLRRIAPVMLLDAFRADQDNAQAAVRLFLQLAEWLGRVPQAQQRLAAIDQRFAQLRAQLQAHYPQGLPPVALIRFASPSIVYVYGDNSLPQAALARLGIRNLWPQPPTAFGVTQRPVAGLGDLQSGVLLYLQPATVAQPLFRSVLWQALPLVKQQRVAAVASTWTYGGVVSLQYLAEALTASLLSVPVQSAAD